MKLNWFRKNSKIILLCILLLISFGMIVKSNEESVKRMKGGNIILKIIAPFLKPINYLENKTVGVFKVLFQNKKLVAENTELKLRLAEALNENQVLHNDIDILTTQTLMISAYSTHNFKFIGAETLLLSSNKYSRTIIIDKGYLHGVKENMPVVNENGLVGIVRVVSDKSSTVQLIIDQNSFIGAKIVQTNDRCIVYGTGVPTELHLKLEILSPEIKMGNNVVTAGLKDSLYPPGINVGKITSFVVDIKGNKVAVVQPEVNFQKILNVLIIAEKN